MAFRQSVLLCKLTVIPTLPSKSRSRRVKRHGSICSSKLEGTAQIFTQTMLCKDDCMPPLGDDFPSTPVHFFFG
ncbi:hypothetical protein F5B19DRAFT_480312 [Rostrohypoxylon terebratum]|nr:hypothetical protein F5B19DRAFT_480312 [Rostrohypoxylon terebratum]